MITSAFTFNIHYLVKDRVRAPAEQLVRKVRYSPPIRYPQGEVAHCTRHASGEVDKIGKLGRSSLYTKRETEGECITTEAFLSSASMEKRICQSPSALKNRRREIIIGPLLKDTSAESSLAYLEYAKDVYAYFVDLENKACNNELINP